MDRVFWIIMAFLAGAILPFQAGLNTKLGKAVESPGYASLLSFVVGMLGLLVYLVLTRQTVSWSGIKEAPAHVWLGGLMGAFYVTTIILAFPKLGPGLTFGLVVAGQMIFSVVLEHNNILVAQQSPVNLMKILGIALVIAGVVIIRKY
ncbi:MAG: DMT family transporter [Saprospiraceae bacterium]|nr:DMT family transporter [Saprospiraceae bacterium]